MPVMCGADSHVLGVLRLVGFDVDRVASSARGIENRPPLRLPDHSGEPGPSARLLSLMVSPMATIKGRSIASSGLPNV